MRFNQDSSSSGHLVRAYRQGEIQIDAETFRESVFVSASSLETAHELRTIEDLSGEAAAEALLLRFKALAPEIALIGTGPRQVFPPATIRAAFLKARIGLEVMDSGAACRTFNVLVGEGRRVAALILV